MKEFTIYTDNLTLIAILLCSVVFALSFVFRQHVDEIVNQQEKKSSTRIFEKYVSGYDIISELSMNILDIKSDIFLSIDLSFYIARIIANIASESI